MSEDSVNASAESELETTSSEDSSDETSEQELASTAEEASEADNERESNKDQSSEDGDEKKALSPLQKLIDSKGGEEKFLASIYEGWNSSKQLASELGVIKEFISEQREKETAKIEEAPLDLSNDEDYQALQEDIGVLDEELQENTKLRSELVSSFNSYRDEINKLKGQFGLADEFNKGEIVRKIERLEDKQRNLDKDWKQSLKEDKQIERSRKNLAQQAKNLEKQLSESRTKQKQSLNEDLEYQADFRQAFEGAISDAATQRGVEEDNTKLREHLKETIRAEAIVYLQRLQNKGVVNPELPDDFVAKRSAAYFEVHGLVKKANFKDIKKAPLMQKLNNSSGAQRSSGQQTAAKMPKNMSADQAREWISKKAREVAARK